MTTATATEVENKSGILFSLNRFTLRFEEKIEPKITDE